MSRQEKEIADIQSSSVCMTILSLQLNTEIKHKLSEIPQDSFDLVESPQCSAGNLFIQFFVLQIVNQKLC